MSCCGEPRAPLPMGRPRARTTGRGDLRVVYVGGNSQRVRGAYTGRIYHFSPAARTQLVDALDSRVLFRTRYFRRG